MTTKYTPGPWLYSTGSVYKAKPLDDNGYPTSAISHMDRENPDTFGAERDANARLIAAAPDLFLALSELLAECDAERAQQLAQLTDGGERAVWFEDTFGEQLAREAIAKAKRIPL